MRRPLAEATLVGVLCLAGAPLALAQSSGQQAFERRPVAAAPRREQLGDLSRLRQTLFGRHERILRPQPASGLTSVAASFYR